MYKQSKYVYFCDDCVFVTDVDTGVVDLEKYVHVANYHQASSQPKSAQGCSESSNINGSEPVLLTYRVKSNNSMKEAHIANI